MLVEVAVLVLVLVENSLPELSVPRLLVEREAPLFISTPPRREVVDVVDVRLFSLTVIAVS